MRKQEIIDWILKMQDKYDLIFGEKGKRPYTRDELRDESSDELRKIRKGWRKALKGGEI